MRGCGRGTGAGRSRGAGSGWASVDGRGWGGRSLWGMISYGEEVEA